MKKESSLTKSSASTKKYFPTSVKASVRKLTQNYRKKNASNESVEDFLRTLVAFPTATDDVVANRGAIKYVERYLQSLGMHTEYHEPDGQPALWATTTASQKHPRILLAAHMDVIPAKKEAFSLRKENGKYYGRGTMDMKGALAAYMKAIANLEGPLSHYDFGVVITSDEEIGGKDGVNGVQRFLDKGYGADFVVLPDGGDNWHFEESAKGYLHFTLEAHGKAAHGSRPWEGDNALVNLMNALQVLQEPFANQGPETSTINVGAIHGGEVANKIPGTATAEISFRPIDQQAMVDLAKFAKETCKKYGVAVHTRAVFDPLQHSFDEPHIKALFDIVKSIRGERPKGMRSHAGSDARHFMEAGIPVAVFYPAGNGHHSDNEWLECKSLQQMEEIFTLFLQSQSTT